MGTHVDGVEGTDQPPAPLALRLGVVGGGALLVWFGIAALDGMLPGDPRSLTRHATNAVLTTVLATLLVVAARRWLDRRPLRGLGLWTESTALRDLALGALTWLLPAGAGLALATAAGWVTLSVDGTALDVVRVVLLLVVLVLVLEAWPEELVFRGYLHRNLEAAMAPWLAVAVQALFFTVFGTALWVVTAGWGVFVERAVLFAGMGVVLGCIRLAAGSVWAPIGFHLVFQVVMQLVLGGRYLTVTPSDPDLFTLVTAGAAFAAGVPVALWLWRGRDGWSWTRPEPDQPSHSRRSRP